MRWPYSSRFWSSGDRRLRQSKKQRTARVLTAIERMVEIVVVVRCPARWDSSPACPAQYSQPTTSGFCARSTSKSTVIGTSETGGRRRVRPGRLLRRRHRRAHRLFRDLVVPLGRAAVVAERRHELHKRKDQHAEQQRVQQQQSVAAFPFRSGLPLHTLPLPPGSTAGAAGIAAVPRRKAGKPLRNRRIRPEAEIALERPHVRARLVHVRPAAWAGTPFAPRARAPAPARR